jgi:hypothetical protein
MASFTRMRSDCWWISMSADFLRRRTLSADGGRSGACLTWVVAFAGRCAMMRYCANRPCASAATGQRDGKWLRRWEPLTDKVRRVQRHPLETVAATFAAGIAVGTAIGWMLRKSNPCCKADAREKGLGVLMLFAERHSVVDRDIIPVFNASRQ